MSSPRLPGPDKRHLIIGRTGSGKTHMALFQLSLRDFDERPWIIMNSKGDENIDAIQGTQELSLTSAIPEEPGLYIIRPLPDHDDTLLEDFLWRVWRRGGVGLYLDEGYMIPKTSKAFRAILTQGRSKQIPVITNTQRPVFLDRFAISESDFVQVFHIVDERDKKTIQSYVPVNLDNRLDEFHSYYYDIGRDDLTELGPAPSMSSILTTFRNRLIKIRDEKETLGRVSRKARAL